MKKYNKTWFNKKKKIFPKRLNIYFKLLIQNFNIIITENFYLFFRIEIYL